MRQAIVFGATGSVGKEIVKVLRKEGYHIIGTSHTHPAKNTEDNDIEIVPLDFSDREQVNAFCGRIEQMGPIDFVTNTIGSYTMNRFEHIPFPAFEKDVQLNFLNYALVLQKVVPKLRKDANLIFILTEMVVGEPNYFLSSYVSSKYALLGLMKSLAGELKQRKVRVNAISPGMMETKFSEHVPAIIKEQYIRVSPLQRMIRPEEVGAAVKTILEGAMTGENILLLGKPHDHRH